MLSNLCQARAIQYIVSGSVNSSYLYQRGTMNWMAPEVVDHVDGDNNPNEIICTKQSDMWSYGMVIYVSSFQMLDFPFDNYCFRS